MKKHLQAWFGLLGGAIAWLIHLVAGSVIGESGCILEGSNFLLFGISSVGWILYALSGAMLGIAAWSMIVARKLKKDLLEEEPIRFMGKAGAIANLFFIVVIGAQTTSIPFLLKDC